MWFICLSYRTLESDRTIASSSFTFAGFIQYFEGGENPPFSPWSVLCFRAHSIFLSMTSVSQTQSFSYISKSYEYTYNRLQQYVGQFPPITSKFQIYQSTCYLCTISSRSFYATERNSNMFHCSFDMYFCCCTSAIVLLHVNFNKFKEDIFVAKKLIVHHIMFHSVPTYK